MAENSAISEKEGVIQSEGLEEHSGITVCLSSNSQKMAENSAISEKEGLIQSEGLEEHSGISVFLSSNSQKMAENSAISEKEGLIQSEGDIQPSHESQNIRPQQFTINEEARTDINTENDLSQAKEELLKNLDKLTENKTQESATPSMEVDITIDKNSGISVNLLASLELNQGNFFKGCKWAPDGFCLMTCSEDNVIRLMNTPREILAEKWDQDSGSIAQLNACLTVKEAEIIYDYIWWPLMNSAYPETCCFVTTAKDQPIHLWDAFNGELRASYIAKNNVDEVHAAHCVGFSPDGLQMICGFTKEIRLFYIDRPGSSCEIWPTRKQKKASGQRGIISTVEFSPDGATIACGSYDGTSALYSSKNGELVGLFNSKSKGVTQVKFSPDGNRLYSGSRMNNCVVCWDVRYMRAELFILERTVETNQKIYFDFASKTSLKRDLVTEDFVLSGSTTGELSFWDVSPLISASEGQELAVNAIDSIFSFTPHGDCTNGVDFHPYLPVLATSSGQRHFADVPDSEGDSDSEFTDFAENTLKLWHIKGLDT